MTDQSRSNTNLTDLIERCIILAETDRSGAVAAMIAASVPDSVIARALCEPGRRRATIRSNK